MSSPIPFTSVNITDKFWSARLQTSRDVTIDTCIQKCLETGRIANFARAAKLDSTPHEGRFYNDSDVYKLLEGIAYTLHTNYDSELEKRADEIIDLIAAAQEDDGYINTYFQLVRPQDKWTDMNLHEMYCGGHLIEAGIAYRQATDKDKLLNVGIRFADHIDSIFGPGKRHWVAGHQEIELALIKLYLHTGSEKYLDLAEFLLGERGHGYGIKDGDPQKWNKEYYQDTCPIEFSENVMGHAVRGVYMYSAIADVIRLRGHEQYEKALQRLWKSMVARNYYVTGGIGQSAHNEGLTADYDLPNLSYCETCAAIAMVYWNARMCWLYDDAKYMDVVERSMYNNALSGVSLSGDKFFYDNPLISDGTYHRSPWFTCSCCPTQLARFIPSIGGYVYSVDEDALIVNLYVDNHAEFGDYVINMKTDYPYDGKVTITIESAPADSKLKIRIPGWCKGAKIKGHNYDIDKGYAVINGVCSAMTVEVEFEMPVKYNHAIEYVAENRGCVALSRGPLVYCFEQQDNTTDLEQLVIPDNAVLTVNLAPDLLGGTNTIEIYGRSKKLAAAIPYCLWDNREAGAMKVWLKEQITADELYK
jgi:DUF1680 family protein